MNNIYEYFLQKLQQCHLVYLTYTAFFTTYVLYYAIQFNIIKSEMLKYLVIKFANKS